MKKLLALALAGVMVFSLAACGAKEEAVEETVKEETTEEVAEEEATPETVTVAVKDAEGNLVDVEFPVAPERIVVLNFQTMDFLDAVGMGDRVVGFIKGGSMPEHLKKYADDENIANVGGMKDIDMEMVMSLEPDVIFSSDRTAKMYNEFSAIAPTMSAAVDYKGGSFMEGYKTLAENHAAIMGVGSEVDEIIAGYDERIAAIKEIGEGKTALLGIFADGLNTLGNEGRCNILVTDMGFENLAGDENVNHGNVSSYEAWLEMNPEYMFILDKDTAVGTEAVAAKEQMETDNPVIAETDAYKNGKIIYLEPGANWYIADGGITSMDSMLTCVEEGLGIK